LRFEQFTIYINTSIFLLHIGAYLIQNGYLKCKKLNLKVFYEKEIRLTCDNSHTPLLQARDTWWNGIYFAILQK
jgi:hypothetical protein